VDRDGKLPTPERERLEHPREPEDMIGVEMREEDVLGVDEPGVGAQELPLRTFTAVDQEPVTPAPEERRRRATGCGGSRGRRSEEDEIEVHGRRS
jgi:hypothetical protein